MIDSASNNSITTGVVTIDISTSSVFRTTLNANISSFTVNNANSASAKVNTWTHIFSANGTAYTITWTFNVGAQTITAKWPGGTAPTLTSVSGKYDIFSFALDGNTNNIYGFIGGQNF